MQWRTAARERVFGSKPVCRSLASAGLEQSLVISVSASGKRCPAVICSAFTRTHCDSHGNKERKNHAIHQSKFQDNHSCLLRRKCREWGRSNRSYLGYGQPARRRSNSGRSRDQRTGSSCRCDGEACETELRGHLLVRSAAGRDSADQLRHAGRSHRAGWLQSGVRCKRVQSRLCCTGNDVLRSELLSSGRLRSVVPSDGVRWVVQL